MNKETLSILKHLFVIRWICVLGVMIAGLYVNETNALLVGGLGFIFFAIYIYCAIINMKYRKKGGTII